MLPSSMLMARSMTLVSVCTVEEHLGDLALYVGEHVEDHWAFRLSGSLQEWSDSSSAALRLDSGVMKALANAKLYAATAEYL